MNQDGGSLTLEGAARGCESRVLRASADANSGNEEGDPGSKVTRVSMHVKIERG